MSSVTTRSRVKNGGPGPWEFEDGRDLFDEPRLDPDEAYANQFAAELLMPGRSSRNSPIERAALALDFGVPATRSDSVSTIGSE